MRTTLKACLSLLLVFTLILSLASCVNDQSPKTQSSTQSQSEIENNGDITTSKRPTSPAFPKIPVKNKYAYVPPVTGDDFDAWYKSYKPVDIWNAQCNDIEYYCSESNEGRLYGLYDRIDQWSFAPLGNSEYDFIGWVDETCTVILELPEETAVSAYAIVTGFNQDEFESPFSWTLYGCNLPPDEARRGDWVELDAVGDADIDEKLKAPYGFTISQEKVNEYKYYKFVFWGSRWSDELDSIYIESLFLYTAPET